MGDPSRCSFQRKVRSERHVCLTEVDGQENSLVQKKRKVGLPDLMGVVIVPRHEGFVPYENRTRDYHYHDYSCTKMV